MACRLLLHKRLHLLALAALPMLTLACQPINEEPDAGPPVNHPPRIVDGFESPQAVVIDAYQASSSCAQPISFSLGKVEDDDIDQTLQERWFLNFSADQTSAQHYHQNTLSRVQNAATFATDDPKEYQFIPSEIATFKTGDIQTVDVFVSDGFDSSDNLVSVKPGSYVVRKSWVVIMSGACSSP